MAQLKGLKVVRRSEDEFEVYPIFFSKGAGARTAISLGAAGNVLAEVVGKVLAKLTARQDLKG